MNFKVYLFIFLCFSKISAQIIDSIAIKQVDSLVKVSIEFTAKRNFEKAFEVNGEAEKISLQKFGSVSASYGKSCSNRGRIFLMKKDYSEAEKWYLESMAIWEKVLGKVNPDYAGSLINLGIVYRNTGKFGKAELLLLEAKDIFEQSLRNQEHPYYFNCLNTLGILYMDNGDYAKAENFYLKCIDLRKKIQGKEHVDYASGLQNLGNLYLVMGLYEKVEPLYLQALDICVKALGKNHPQYAQIVNNLGNFYYRSSQYDKAETFYLEAKAIRENIEKDSPEFCGNLINLGSFYTDMGNYEKAEMLYQQAKDIFKQKLNNRTHPFYFNCLNNLAQLYNQIGQYEKAESLQLQTKENLEKTLGSEHPNVATSLNTLAILNLQMGKKEKAESLYLQSKEIREKKLGKEHPVYTESLNNLGNFYTNTGDFGKAESLFLESKAIREKVLGKTHRDYSMSLNNLAYLYEKEHRFSESNSLLAEFFPLQQDRVVKSANFLSERELAFYSATFQRFGNTLNNYILNRSQYQDLSKHDFLPSLGYNLALFQKGFLLNAATRLNRLAESKPEAREINIQLKAYRRRLAKEYAKRLTEQKNTTELEENANKAEKEIARLINGYSQAIQQLKWEDVMATLKSEEASIEFITFKVDFPSNTDSIMYGALLLRQGVDQPRFIPLFEEKSLDSLLLTNSVRKADYVNNLYTLADRGAVEEQVSKRSLFELVWKLLEKELSGITTIYYSPSGLLHRINLDAIPVSETETLADRYNLIKLNTTRQLVIPTQQKSVNNDAVLYGGIQFEQDSSTKINEPLFASRSNGDFLSSKIDTSNRGDAWTYLSGTEREVNTLEKIMQTSGMQIKLKKGYEATEESFKSIGVNNNPSPRVLHIATHGYFFPDPKENLTKTNLVAEQQLVFKISEHPMLRSGLIMAGGNAAWQGAPTLEGREDGILTAYEISQMNLSNTELVVLSACETGLGDIQGNEGVYGLQRAFKIAGAKYLIMSLWQVPDKQTSLLMTTFYKKWLEEKMSIPDAFHAAQKELRDNGLDPYNWAGFVLVE